MLRHRHGWQERFRQRRRHAILRRPSVLPVLLAMLAWAGSGPAPRAETVTLAGITFSDELGGFEIESGSGNGSLADPFVLIERITSSRPAVLVIRGLDPGFGNRAGTAHQTGFVLRKTVVNATVAIWRSFQVELQQELGKDSTYDDGLSFAQGAGAARRFLADRFAAVRAVDEPLDALVFSDGAVAPAEQATLEFSVTHNYPVPEFYLVQRHDQPVALAQSPPPLPAPPH